MLETPVFSRPFSLYTFLDSNFCYATTSITLLLIILLILSTALFLDDDELACELGDFFPLRGILIVPFFYRVGLNFASSYIVLIAWTFATSYSPLRSVCVSIVFLGLLFLRAS